MKRLLTVIFVGLYIFLEVSVLRWGIPTVDRVFLYHMDEWHQLMAVRALVRQGTSNTEGAANGPVFQFIVAGIWAAPAIFTKFADIEHITTPISGLLDQEKLFMVLRLNTLFFGLATFYVLREILKKILYVNRTIIGLYIFAPGWLFLSNYFKYDIALIFWITSSIFLLLQYGKQLHRKWYIFSGIGVGLAIATKISAVPLLPLYFFAYFLYEKNWRRHLPTLSYGLTTALITFCIFGIPDLLFLAKGDYLFYLYDNIITVPASTSNFILPTHYLLYLFTHQFLATFGAGFTFLCISVSFLSFIYRKKLKFRISKDEWLLVVGAILFLLSILPLKMYLVGNRYIVLFPFIFLVLSVGVRKLFVAVTNTIGKRLLHIVIGLSIALQITHGLTAFSIRWFPDPRQTASEWIERNLQNQTIGIENIPIYQMIPDIALKEKYESDYYNQITAGREYVVIDSQTEKLPQTIIITNTTTKEYFYRLEKIDLLKKLEQRGYRQVASFKPNLNYYKIFGTQKDLYLSGLSAMPTDITIYSL